MAEMAAATMNSNCGGRDHAATYIEREVIDWCRRTFGFPETASGVLVTGTSQATLVALAVARMRALGPALRRDGLRNAPLLTAYAVDGVHAAIVKALEVLGLGAAALRIVPRRARGAWTWRCWPWPWNGTAAMGRDPSAWSGPPGPWTGANATTRCPGRLLRPGRGVVSRRRRFRRVGQAGAVAVAGDGRGHPPGRFVGL